jgi:hypothetical protein
MFSRPWRSDQRKVSGFDDVEVRIDSVCMDDWPEPRTATVLIVLALKLADGEGGGNVIPSGEGVAGEEEAMPDGRPRRASMLARAGVAPRVRSTLTVPLGPSVGLEL